MPLLLTTISSLLNEISVSLGKKSITSHKETYYQMGFLHVFYSTIFFSLSPLFGFPFYISILSLPTLFAKVVLDIFQIEVTLRAITKTDRSTFSFVRLVTVPLLLGVDLFLGYNLTQKQILGIMIVFVSLVLLLNQKEINKKGILLVLVSSINAVVTISLFKYNITNFNSVTAEQTISLIVLMMYLIFKIKSQNHRGIFKTILNPRFQLQSIIHSLASPTISYAYSLSPASIITTMSRTADIFWSIVIGNRYFHEKGLIKKLSLFALTGVGIFLTIV